MPELVDYLKAGYPFLFIRTVEPDAAEKMVLAAAQSIPDLMKSGKLMVWKATKVIDNEVDNTKPANIHHALWFAVNAWDKVGILSVSPLFRGGIDIDTRGPNPEPFTLPESGKKVLGHHP